MQNAYKSAWHIKSTYYIFACGTVLPCSLAGRGSLGFFPLPGTPSLHTLLNSPCFCHWPDLKNWVNLPVNGSSLAGHRWSYLLLTIVVWAAVPVQDYNCQCVCLYQFKVLRGWAWRRSWTSECWCEWMHLWDEMLWDLQPVVKILWFASYWKWLSCKFTYFSPSWNAIWKRSEGISLKG